MVEGHFKYTIQKKRLIVSVSLGSNIVKAYRLLNTKRARAIHIHPNCTQ